MSDRAGPAPAERIEFLDVDFTPWDAAAVGRWLRRRTADDRFAYVVTPNVDHVVRLHRDGGPLADAYRQADLCVCDSRVLSRLARLRGVALPVVPGSDLTAELFRAILRPGDRVGLIGGTGEVAARLRRRFPAFEIVHHEPPMGLLHDAAARTAAVRAAAEAGARFTLLAVGTPQGERIAHEMKRAGTVRGTALSIGASVDFLVGAQTRAPGPVQRAGLEWAWRLLTEPRRLWRRYLVEGPAILPLVLRWRRRP